MAKLNSRKINGTPIAEGVRFEQGSVAVYAVRNENRDVGVRVRQESHYMRDLLEKIPLVRGVVRFFSAIARFFSGLDLSASLNPQRVVRGNSAVRRFTNLFSTTPQALIALFSGLMIPIILFAAMVGLPWLVEQGLLLINGLPRFAINAVCCVFRVMGFVLSLYGICRLKLMNRLCMYRGAISKVMNAFEAFGPELTHENVVLSSRLTDRSDGAFCAVVAMISIIAFAFVRTDGLLVQLAVRVAIILAAAAVSNELILPLERAKPESFGALLRRPLIGLQQLFTIEPHNQMIEVAVCAFRALRDRI